jgi:hypothetical protein
MYCIVTEAGLLFFHVMGGGSAPNTDMAAAINSSLKSAPAMR